MGPGDVVTPSSAARADSNSRSVAPSSSSSWRNGPMHSISDCSSSGRLTHAHRAAADRLARLGGIASRIVRLQSRWTLWEAAQPAQNSAWASRAAVSSPASVEPVERIVADRLQQAVSRFSGWSTPSNAISDLSARRSTRSRTSYRSTSPKAPTTASAAAIVNGPENTPSRRSAARSAASSRSWLQSIDALSVCWRSTTVRAPPVSSRKRSSSWRAISPIARIARARSGQLDRQRNAIESATDPGDRVRIIVAQHEIRLSPARPVKEQSGRVGAFDRIHGRGAATRRARRGRGHARPSRREPTAAPGWSSARVTDGSAVSSSSTNDADAPITCSQLSSTNSVARSRSGQRATGPAGCPDARARRSRPAPRPVPRPDR